MEFWSSRMFEKIRAPNPPANDEFTLLRLRSSRNTPFSSHWILAIPPSLRWIGDRKVKIVDLLSLTAATSIGGLIITASKQFNRWSRKMFDIVGGNFFADIITHVHYNACTCLFFFLCDTV